MIGEPLGVAVWGLGPHARRNLLGAVRATPGMRLAGVCSRDAAVVQAEAAAHGCRGWTAPEAMLEDPAVHAVFVATPIALHAPHGLAVLAAGRHCLMEKPLAATLAEVEALVAAAVAQRRVLMEGFMYLHHAHMAAVRSLLDGGRLGSLHALTARFGIPALERPGFRADPALGGGAFLDVGCYPLSLASALLVGEPRVLHAEMGRRPGESVDGWGRALLADERGVRATLEWGVGVAYRNELDLWGEAGSAFTDRIFSKAADVAPRLGVRDMRGATEWLEVPADRHFERMLAAFAALTADASLAGEERGRAVQRARLRERVRMAST